MTMTKQPQESEMAKRMRLEAEAKRDAILSEVSEEQLYGYRKLPKKVGTITCDTGVKTGYRNTTVTFDLRLASDGNFVAVHGDRVFKSKSKDALQLKLDMISKVTLDLVWARYLEIDYQAEANTDKKSWYSNDTTVSLEDRDALKIAIVYGIKLKWADVEFSSVFQLDGKDARMFRKFGSKDQERKSAELPVGLVVWTEERLALLNSVREALKKLDTKLASVFAGDADAIAKRLDMLDSSKLLGGGK